MVYRTHILGGDHGEVVIDHADTIEMGGGGRSADSQRELAISYAQTGIAQAKRQGYNPVRATVVEASTGRVVWDSRDIFVGQTVECHVCGTRVTAVIEPINNLTVLRAEYGTPCIDGDTRHPWPN